MERDDLPILDRLLQAAESPRPATPSGASDEALVEVAAVVRTIVEAATQEPGPGDSPAGQVPVAPETSVDRSGFLAFDIARFSTEAAGAWLQLHPATRKKLASEIQSGTRADAADVIATAFRTLQGLAGLPQRLGKLESMTAEVLEKQEKILGELKDIRGRLQTIDAKLDEKVLVGVRQGLHHLLNAANSEVDQVRTQQLQLASGAFTALAQLDEHGATVGTSGMAMNSSLIVLGHWGNHLYFQMQGDSRNSLLQVYTATRRFPRKSIVIFPAEYFTRDYQAEIRSLESKHSAAKQRLDKAQSNNAQRASTYENNQLLRGVGAVAAGIAAATVGGALTTLVGFGPSGSLFGVQAARAIMHGGGRPPTLLDTTSLEQEVARYQAEIDCVFRALAQECDARVKVLQTVTLNDLRRMTKSQG